MNTKELFAALGLTQDTINQLINDVKLHNFQMPGNLLPEIDVEADANSFPVSLTAMLGRAIAKERGRLYLDDKQKHPLILETNAFSYGYLELSKIFAKDNKETDPKEDKI